MHTEAINMLEFILNNPKLIWALLSLLGVILLVAAAIRYHLSDTYKDFSLVKLFAFDSKTGNLSDSKARLNIAFIMMTWAFIYITMQDKLTEWYVAVYATAWIGDRFIARKLSGTAPTTEGPKNDTNS